MDADAAAHGAGKKEEHWQQLKQKCVVTTPCTWRIPSIQRAGWSAAGGVPDLLILITGKKEARLYDPFMPSNSESYENGFKKDVAFLTVSSTLEGNPQREPFVVPGIPRKEITRMLSRMKTQMQPFLKVLQHTVVTAAVT